MHSRTKPPRAFKRRTRYHVRELWNPARPEEGWNEVVPEGIDPEDWEGYGTFNRAQGCAWLFCRERHLDRTRVVVARVEVLYYRVDWRGVL